MNKGGFRDLARALLAVARTRKPPWELRAATNILEGLDGVFLIKVDVILEVNHVSRIVAIRQVLHKAVN